MPDRDQSGRGGDLEDEAESLVVDAGDLHQPLDVTHPESAAAQLGDRRARQRLEHHLDLAEQVDGRAGGDGVDVGRLGLRHHGVGRGELGGPGRFAAHHLTHQPRQDHGVGVHLPQQTGRQQPLHRTVGRGAGCRVAGAADRRPVDESLQQFALRADRCPPAAHRSALASRSAASSVTWPGIPGQSRRGLGGHPHRGVAPHQRPGAQVVDGGASAAPRGRARRSTRTAWSTARPRSRRATTAARRAPRAGAKSRSSVAALTDCRDWARAASAAIEPGGGWVRSGRNSSSRMSRSSGSSANQAPSGTPGDTCGHC